MKILQKLKLVFDDPVFLLRFIFYFILVLFRIITPSQARYFLLPPIDFIEELIKNRR
ncbi:MAG: hypothetical protein FCKEOINB_01409 [Nitrosomonas sp.]|nr:hypothetical protein [Nitrosomonas sp.]HNB02470.1 hypothetical protein [Nitrosomonas sp.]